MAYIETSSIFSELTQEISHPGSSEEVIINAPIIKGRLPVIAIVAYATATEKLARLESEIEQLKNARS